MNTRFDLDRTIQASAYLLKLQEFREMSYLRLIKLLYLAERELLSEKLMTLTGDTPYALREGPVLSHTLDLAKEKPALGMDRWAEHFSRKGYVLSLVQDPGHGKLSRTIREKLDEVNHRYAELDDFALVNDVAHKLPEWLRHWREGVPCEPISWEETMAYQGKTQEEIGLALAREKSRQEIDSFFGS